MNRKDIKAFYENKIKIVSIDTYYDQTRRIRGHKIFDVYSYNIGNGYTIEEWIPRVSKRPGWTGIYATRLVDHEGNVLIHQTGSRFYIRGTLNQILLAKLSIKI